MRKKLKKAHQKAGMTPKRELGEIRISQNDAIDEMQIRFEIYLEKLSKSKRANFSENKEKE